MSVFVNSLKTFESDITGQKREYKINNAVWVHMKAKFELTQTQWAIEYGQEEVLFGAKFVVCVLKANGLDVTEQEVLENTDSMDIMNFVYAYQVALLGKREEEEEEAPEGK